MKRSRIHRAARLAAALAGIAVVGPVAAAAAADATWTGGAASDTWSSGGNWSGGVAPSGSLGTLSLPAASPTCVSWSCSFGVDDIPSLVAETLQIDSSNNYLITPATATDEIELTGGLSFSTGAAPASTRLLTKMVVPLVLGAGQTWSVSGLRGTPTELALGAVTGEPYPLTVKLTGGVTLQAAEIDTGLLRLSGGGDVVIADQMAQPADGVTAFPPPLIGSQGVELTGGASLEFASPDAVSGPIAVAPGSYSTLQIGHGVAPDGTATVDGDVTLRANSTLQMWIDQAAVTAPPAGERRRTPPPAGKRRRTPPSAGKRRRTPPPVPQPSTDASRLTVFGTLNLNEANLALSQGFTDTQVDCAALAGGQVYTLIAATQLDGSFSRIANGQVVPLGACNPLGAGTYAVIISYNTRARPETVTATIVGPAQVRALVGRTLRIPSGSTLGSVLAAGGNSTIFNAPTAGALSLTWTTVSHGRRVTLARGSALASRVGPRQVPIKLTAAGRRLLFAAANPPVPKPRKTCTRRKHKCKRRPKPPPKPRPRPVTITATADFTANGRATVSVSRRFTLR